jgi:hypothetical protein
MPTSARAYEPRVDDALVAAVRPLASALQRLHPTRVDGVEKLPAGPALLVGNHGLLG